MSNCKLYGNVLSQRILCESAVGGPEPLGGGKAVVQNELSYPQYPPSRLKMKELAPRITPSSLALGAS